MKQKLPVLYADPVDEDGEPIATVWMWVKPNPWTGGAVKVPYEPKAPSR